MGASHDPTLLTALADRGHVAQLFTPSGAAHATWRIAEAGPE
jgi:hypothetical protein